MAHFAVLRFATLTSLACSIHGLAHSLHSLPHGTVEIHESVFTLKFRLKETNAFVIVTRNTPNICSPPWSPGLASSVPFVAAAEDDEFAASTVGVVISGEFSSGVTVEPVAVIVVVVVAIVNAVDSRLMGQSI